MTGALDPAQTVAMLRRAAQAVIDRVDDLTEADMATGDGDHGIGMRRGCEAALTALEADGLTSAEAFRKTGMAFMSKTGGAAGAVFGTFFRAGAPALEADGLTPGSFAAFLEQSGAAVAKRGGVEEGAKTMLDALMPAARAARDSAAAGDLATVMAAAARGALDGVEATKPMLATTGKARSLGERSIGHPDPGAISVAILLGAMHKHIQSI